MPATKTNTVPPADARGTGHVEVESVSIGDYVPSQQATAIFGASGAELKVSAKATGVAAGAAGNGWRIFGYDDRATATLDTIAFDIDVAVDIANQRISYTISDVVPARPHREARISDLAAALVSDSDFDANFSVSYSAAAQTKLTALGATGPAGVGFGDTTGEMIGRTDVGVVVKFNAAIASLSGSTAGDDLLFDIAPSFPGAPGVAAAAGTADTKTVTVVYPDRQVHITYTSDSMAQLPRRAGFRVIEADVAFGYDGAGTAHAGAGEGNLREILHNLRPDSRINPVPVPAPAAVS